MGFIFGVEKTSKHLSWYRLEREREVSKEHPDAMMTAMCMKEHASLCPACVFHPLAPGVGPLHWVLLLITKSHQFPLSLGSGWPRLATFFWGSTSDLRFPLVISLRRQTLDVIVYDDLPLAYSQYHPGAKANMHEHSCTLVHACRFHTQGALSELPPTSRWSTFNPWICDFHFQSSLVFLGLPSTHVFVLWQHSFRQNQWGWCHLCPRLAMSSCHLNALPTNHYVPEHGPDIFCKGFCR